jgi:hypothetical protein
MQDKKFNTLEYLTGFMMGLTIGIWLEFSILRIYNWIAILSGGQPLEAAWWMAVPVPVILGFGMAKNIASLHLEDY